ncbi:hypothetical protein BDW60DRAFT_212664 [Aspergillus nidulans var. acristatus]
MPMTKSLKHYRLPKNLRVEDWIDVIEDYSTRRLTVSNDRFIALSGIAHRFQQDLQLQYIAGLWHSEKDQTVLLRLLLWTSGIENAEHEADWMRSARYNGPSWSWATSKCPIVYNSPPVLPVPGYSRRDFHQWHAKIHSTYVVTNGLNPFAYVKDARLTISAPLLQGYEISTCTSEFLPKYSNGRLSLATLVYEAPASPSQLILGDSDVELSKSLKIVTNVPGITSRAIGVPTKWGKREEGAGGWNAIPNIIAEIRQKLTQCETELKKMGEARTSPRVRGLFVHQFCSEISGLLTRAFWGSTRMSPRMFPKLRLRYLVHQRLDEFTAAVLPMQDAKLNVGGYADELKYLGLLVQKPGYLTSQMGLSDVYSFGESESIIGKALTHHNTTSHEAALSS